jgi:putative ABC transport system permease protein
MRFLLTLFAVAIAIVAFVLLRTITAAYFVFVDSAADDRLVTRHKVSPRIPLPKRMLETVRQVPGVRAATGGSAFGTRTAKRPDYQVFTVAVDTNSFMQVFHEIELPPDALSRWQSNRQGALLGAYLARKLGVSEGDRLTISGLGIDWEVVVEGVYTTPRLPTNPARLFFHWEYLNSKVPETDREQIYAIFALLESAESSGTVAAAIDGQLETGGITTITMSERAQSASLLGGVAAVLRAIDIGAAIILLIVLLILGNTIALGVRERTNEYGVLRAIGFVPRQIGLFIMAEGLAVGLLAGLLGLVLSYPLIEVWLGRWLVENVSDLVPYFRIRPDTYVIGFGAACALGIAAAALPALRASRLSVVEALRRVD